MISVLLSFSANPKSHGDCITEIAKSCTKLKKIFLTAVR